MLRNVQIWLCGGSILVAPCSHVGHVFRFRRPYKSKPGIDSKLYNSVRAIKVWFDDYAVSSFLFPELFPLLFHIIQIALR